MSLPFASVCINIQYSVKTHTHTHTNNKQMHKTNKAVQKWRVENGEDTQFFPSATFSLSNRVCLLQLLQITNKNTLA